EGGFAGEGEIGGRVWSIDVGGDVERGTVGDEALVWLGPDKVVGEVHEGRRVWKTSDPSREKETLARVEREPHRTTIDVRIHGEFGVAPTYEATSARGARASVIGDAPVERARSAATS